MYLSTRSLECLCSAQLTARLTVHNSQDRQLGDVSAYYLVFLSSIDRQRTLSENLLWVSVHAERAYFLEKVMKSSRRGDPNLTKVATSPAMLLNHGLTILHSKLSILPKLHCTPSINPLRLTEEERCMCHL